MFFQDVAITFTSVYKFPKHKVSNFVLTKKGKNPFENGQVQEVDRKRVKKFGSLETKYK